MVYSVLLSSTVYVVVWMILSTFAGFIKSLFVASTIIFTNIVLPCSIGSKVLLINITQHSWFGKKLYETVYGPT